MATNFFYNIADFPFLLVDTNRLWIEINESTIVQVLENIKRTGDDFEIIFATDLLPAEEVTLDGLVASHTGEEPEIHEAEFHGSNRDPTANDDFDKGACLGTQWFNTNTDEYFICVDATVGAAVWRRLSVSLSDSNPADIGPTAPGIGLEASRADHVHDHGDQAGGTLHAEVTETVNGFMSASDKIKINQINNTGVYAVPATVSISDIVYCTGSYTADVADNNSLLTIPCLGIVIDKPTPTSAVVLYTGEAPVFSGLTVGKRYFLSNNGNITNIPPTTIGKYIQAVGVAVNPTTLVIGFGPLIGL